MNALGKITRITDLRTIWPHEAKDFSKWLAQEENLIELSNAIGIDIALEERESGRNAGSETLLNLPGSIAQSGPKYSTSLFLS